jgi:hypothetical protein
MYKHETMNQDISVVFGVSPGTPLPPLDDLVYLERCGRSALDFHDNGACGVSRIDLI